MRRLLLVLMLCALPFAGDRTSEATPTPNVPRVIVRNLTRPGAVEIVAQATVSLDARLMVESMTDDGRWVAMPSLDLGSMRLVETCDQPIRACISLEAGHVLRPVPWSGMSCSSQCNGNCDKNVPRLGRHRFVVSTCDGKERFTGAPFVVSAAP